MSAPPKPLMLIVMDGWGYRENPEHNAIAKARKPTWDYFWQNYPHTLIHASEAAVGLPSNQMGNSEVGHLNIGAGRVVYQEYTRINRAIGSGTFFTNKTLTDAVDLAVSTGKAVHILGLLSPGGVHSHEEQIHAMAELAVKRGAKQLYLHAFLDGRDTPPRSAAASIKATEEKFAALGQGRIASIIGRYYAMDRDHRWPRIQAAYDLITQGKAEHTATTASEGLELAYARGESDEFVAATTIVPHRDAPMPRAQDAQERLPPGGAQGSASVAGGTTPGMEEVGPRREQRPRTPGATGAPVRILDGDVVVFMNFRSDRARQITRPFIEENFDGFERAAWPRLGRFVSLTEYQSEFHVPCAFPPERLRNVLGEYLAAHGIHQLRIAETEKYAHVTFFFNGGEETPFKFEDRILVPSPTDVPTYNQKPEMSAPLVAEKLIEAIRGGVYDVIICNFANPDMVGHTGDFDATVKAIEFLDGCLKRVYDALRAVGGEMLITADHGNAEQMFDNDTRQAHTAHTINPVPFVYVGRKAKIAATGALEDIAPTMLYLLGLPIPPEMSGHALVELNA